MGEQRLCKPKVEGSSPFISTTLVFERIATDLGTYWFRRGKRRLISTGRTEDTASTIFHKDEVPITTL